MHCSRLGTLSISSDDLIAEGERVVIRWTVTGTHKGELRGIAPTGKHVTVMGMVISRFAKGKVEEDWINFDALGLMQQLGVVARWERSVRTVCRSMSSFRDN